MSAQSALQTSAASSQNRGGAASSSDEKHPEVRQRRQESWGRASRELLAFLSVAHSSSTAVSQAAASMSLADTAVALASPSSTSARTSPPRRAHRREREQLKQEGRLPGEVWLCDSCGGEEESAATTAARTSSADAAARGGADDAFSSGSSSDSTSPTSSSTGSVGRGRGGARRGVLPRWNDASAAGSVERAVTSAEELHQAVSPTRAETLSRRSRSPPSSSDAGPEGGGYGTDDEFRRPVLRRAKSGGARTASGEIVACSQCGVCDGQQPGQAPALTRQRTL